MWNGETFFILFLFFCLCRGRSMASRLEKRGAGGPFIAACGINDVFTLIFFLVVSLFSQRPASLQLLYDQEMFTLCALVLGGGGTLCLSSMSKANVCFWKHPPKKKFRKKTCMWNLALVNFNMCLMLWRKKEKKKMFPCLNRKCSLCAGRKREKGLSRTPRALHGSPLFVNDETTSNLCLSLYITNKVQMDFGWLLCIILRISPVFNFSLLLNPSLLYCGQTQKGKGLILKGGAKKQIQITKKKKNWGEKWLFWDFNFF